MRERGERYTIDGHEVCERVSARGLYDHEDGVCGNRGINPMASATGTARCEW